MKTVIQAAAEEFIRCEAAVAEINTWYGSSLLDRPSPEQTAVWREAKAAEDRAAIALLKACGAEDLDYRSDGAILARKVLLSMKGHLRPF